MIRKVIFVLIAFLPLVTLGQKKFIKGYVYDQISKEALIGATILVPRYYVGTSTNNNGFFVLEVSQSDISEIVVSYIGYETKIISISDIEKDAIITIELESKNLINEIVVKADTNLNSAFQSPATFFSLSAQQIRQIPALFGEVDVLKALQLMPGISGGTEGQSGIYVRGGGPDQNLIILDGVPLYNVSHLFGFFSVFNNDAINNVSVYKGGFPARYGGRLSSVIDISMKDGSKNKIHGEGLVGIIATKFTLEGPLIKNRTSFMVSARRTYADLFVTPFINRGTSGRISLGYYFYDFNFKLNHRINPKNQLTFSTYLGDDIFYLRFKNDYENTTLRDNLTWGNKIATFKWNRIVNDNIFSNTAISYSRYNFNVGSTERKGLSNINRGEVLSRRMYQSGIDDFIFNQDFEHTINDKLTLRYGYKGIYHIFNAGVLVDQNKSLNIDTTIGSFTDAFENDIYMENDWTLLERLKINAGLHWNAFITQGKIYQLPQPRLATSYFITPLTNIRASFSTMMQNIHLLSTNSVGLPNDLWVPSTKNIKPQKAWQISSGFSQYVYKKMFELNVEIYYKKMKNTIDYLGGASFILPGQDWQKLVDVGMGRAYGIEFLFQKKLGKTTGWVGYTLSWTKRKYPNINFGREFPYRFDRRHDVSIVLNHKFNSKWDIGIVWVYNTGISLTLPNSEHSVGDINTSFWENNVRFYGERNSFKMPPYHRLDISANKHKREKWGETYWNFSLYNTYGRANAFYVFFADLDGNGVPSLYAQSLFTFIPSVAYGIKF